MGTSESQCCGVKRAPKLPEPETGPKVEPSPPALNVEVCEEHLDERLCMQIRQVLIVSLGHVGPHAPFVAAYHFLVIYYIYLI